MIDSEVNPLNTLSEQMVIMFSNTFKELNTDALIQHLAEIKADVHYLKTEVLGSSSPLEKVDPQTQKLDIHKAVAFSKPIAIKCSLRKRIVGSGWCSVDAQGRWTALSSVSSLVLPYPLPGVYRFEAGVRAEAVEGLIHSLNIFVNNEQLLFSKKRMFGGEFHVILTGEINILSNRVQPFLTLDFVVENTDNSQRLNSQESKSPGLLIDQVSLIPTAKSL